VATDLHFSWTNATLNDLPGCADPDSVDPATPTALTDLRGVHVTVTDISRGKTIDFGEIPSPVEGAQDSLLFSFADTVYYVDIRLWSVDNTGKESCHYSSHVRNLPKQEAAIPPISTGGGLRGEYYSSTAWLNFVTFLMERTDTTVNFNWGLGAPFPGGPVDYFSVRETGYLIAPIAGLYTLSLAHDDGGRLWVDGAAVIDAWVSGNAEQSVTLTLSAGSHPIKVELFEGYGGAKGILSWSGPGITKQVIPKGALMP